MSQLVQRILPLCMAIVSLPAFAQTDVKEGLDFSHCVPAMAPFGALSAYAINDKGNLVYDAKSSGYVSMNHDDASHADVLVMKTNSGYNGAKSKTQTTLTHDANGRPISVSVNISYDKATPYSLASTTTTSFGYDGQHCVVKEMSTQVGGQKDTVSYSKEMCDKLSKALDPLTQQKLMECQSTFSGLAKVIQDYKDSYKKQGRALFSVMGDATSSFGATPDSAMEAISAVGSCNIYRQMFGMPADKGAYPIAFGFTPGPQSAIGGGNGGGIYPSAQSPIGSDAEQNSAPAK